MDETTTLQLAWNVYQNLTITATGSILSKRIGIVPKAEKTRGTLPNQTVAPLANKKNSSLEDQVCIAQTTTQMDSVPKNILNSRTCNIRNTGVCRHQRQPLEN